MAEDEVKQSDFVERINRNNALENSYIEKSQSGLYVLNNIEQIGETSKNIEQIGEERFVKVLSSSDLSFDSQSEQIGISPTDSEKAFRTKLDLGLERGSNSLCGKKMTVRYQERVLKSTNSDKTR